ncbi:hypothetical protein P7K49_033745 [Saguinus oedipus]|uniref:G-protein coupled receptors family 2 profile 2 domain-containing protein n=1 Tax=Saguinus oedipus TaxID=9490 RepID=A0ABQ9TSS1_SAGOE|nr:hypothetical protein P7K49_033745 [Saguinus oedipus]
MLGPAPGPSLNVPDELLLLSPLAHPELVGDDVAGMDTALGTGLDDILREVLPVLPPPGAQAAQAVGVATVAVSSSDDEGRDFQELPQTSSSLLASPSRPGSELQQTLAQLRPTDTEGSIIRILLQKLMSPDVSGNDQSQYKRLYWPTLLLIPLFGVHYMVFAVCPISISSKYQILSEPFLRSFQGLVVAVLYCFLNSEVQCELKRKW